MENVTLPWKKTSTITLTTDAEKKAGLSVSVVPGSVPGSDGMLQPAACVITVDGKKAADNQGGKSDKMCEYTVKRGPRGCPASVRGGVRPPDARRYERVGGKVGGRVVETHSPGFRLRG